MTREQWIAKIIPALSGLAGFFESLKAQHPDLASQLDPKIAELQKVADAGLLGNVIAVSGAELKKMIDEMKLDPRPHPSDLAS